MREHDFTKFHTLKPKLIEDAENVLGFVYFNYISYCIVFSYQLLIIIIIIIKVITGTDFPRLMEALPRSFDANSSTNPTSKGALVYDNFVSAKPVNG